jgi:hypothetical protein
VRLEGGIGLCPMVVFDFSSVEPLDLVQLSLKMLSAFSQFLNINVYAEKCNILQTFCKYLYSV